MRKATRANRAARYTGGAMVVLGLVGIAGCSSGTDAGPEASATVVTTANQQDAVFAKQLIELNEQLIAITDILIAKTDDPAVEKKLSELERTANERIVLAKGWLQRWARTAVQAPEPPGTLTEKQFDALIDSNGPELAAAVKSAAQTQLEGTLEIAQAEVAGGANSAAKQVAQELIASTETELAALAAVSN